MNPADCKSAEKFTQNNRQVVANTKKPNKCIKQYIKTFMDAITWTNECKYNMYTQQPQLDYKIHKLQVIKVSCKLSAYYMKS